MDPIAPPAAPEMFGEINALIAAVAKSMDTSEIDVITAIEQGRLSMELLVDDQGHNFVRVECDGKTADIRQGVFLKREG
jgi:hypothetical protein